MLAISKCSPIMQALDFLGLYHLCLLMLWLGKMLPTGHNAGLEAIESNGNTPSLKHTATIAIRHEQNKQ